MSMSMLPTMMQRLDGTQAMVRRRGIRTICRFVQPGSFRSEMNPGTCKNPTCPPQKKQAWGGGRFLHPIWVVSDPRWRIDHRLASPQRKPRRSPFSGSFVISPRHRDSPLLYNPAAVVAMGDGQKLRSTVADNVFPTKCDRTIPPQLRTA